jgi:hypothetical protein
MPWCCYGHRTEIHFGVGVCAGEIAERVKNLLSSEKEILICYVCDGYFPCDKLIQFNAT